MLRAAYPPYLLGGGGTIYPGSRPVGVTTRSPRMVTMCLLTRSMLIEMYRVTISWYVPVYVPFFDFGCVVWGNTTNANLTRLVKLQKRAARMILKADFITPSEQLFNELNWLPFPKRVQYHTCLMVYKSITGQAPEDISSMLTYVSEHHERQTRSTVLDLLHIPRLHSVYFDRAFSVQGPKLWNRLSADIRNSTSINRLKRELKRCLLYNN